MLRDKVQSGISCRSSYYDYSDCLAYSRFHYKMTEERVTQSNVESLPMEGPLIQAAHTVACGSIFGLTAEPLIDAQDCRTV